MKFGMFDLNEFVQNNADIIIKIIMSTKAIHLHFSSILYRGKK